MNKQEIIDSINKITNEPISSLKKDVYNNTNGDNFKSLLNYNAMLDNITIGAHTTTTIEFAGIEWKLRLLTAEEIINIKKEVLKLAKSEDWYDDVNIHYLTMIKVLSKALSPSPFKTEGKAIFSENDLKLINYDVLENIYRQYIHFNDMATRKPTNMSDEQIQDLLELVKKKHIPLMDLDRKQLLIIANYYMNLSQTQAQMLG